MFFARKFLFFNFWLLFIIYFGMMIIFNIKLLEFDFFNTALIFIGIFLLLKSVCYYSDSSFFFGAIFFLFGLFLHFGFYKYAILVYPLLINGVTFLTYVFFESNLMKFVLYCITILNIINFFVYFLLFR